MRSESRPRALTHLEAPVEGGGRHQARQAAQDVLLEEHNSSLRLSRSFVGVPDDPNSVAKGVDRIQRRDDRQDDSDTDKTPPERIRMRDAPVGVPRFHMSNGCQQVTST
jgi:hypothetical protein